MSCDDEPTDEIEVTPAMIEAGKSEIAGRWMEFTSDGGSCLWEEVMTAVFRAMVRARDEEMHQAHLQLTEGKTVSMARWVELWDDYSALDPIPTKRSTGNP